MILLALIYSLIYAFEGSAWMLKNCRPFLQSRNSALVFSVLLLHIAIFLSIYDKTPVNSPSHYQDNAEKYDEADV